MENKILIQRSKVTKFVSYCEAVIGMPEPNISKVYLEAKKKIITEFFNKMDNVNDEIIQESEGDDLLSEYFTQEEFDKAFSMYDKVMVRIQTKLEKYEKPPKLSPITFPTDVTLNTDKKVSKLKLKPVNIPTFTGDYKKWISFRSMFDSMVHNDKNLSNLEKMHYLQSCLDGEAEDILSQFDITAEAYPEAYNVITERFHNVVILVDTHIMEILSQPKLTSESSNALKGLMDNTEKNLRALKTLEIDTTTWDPILLLLLVQKLDRSTRRLWEQTLKPKVRPTMKEFLEFLNTRYHALGCQQNFNFSIESTENSQPRFRKHKKGFQNEYSFSNGEPFPPRVHQNFHNTSQSKQIRCPLNCGENHKAEDCKSLKNGTPERRTGLINNARLCKNCLKNHPGKCVLKPNCQRCGKYHHTLLHLEQPSTAISSSKANTMNNRQSGIGSQAASTEREIRNHHIHVKQGENHVQLSKGTENTVSVAWDEPILLATAIVLLRSARDNTFYPFRALLDQDSEASYITENVVQYLGLKKTPVMASTSGLGGVTTGSVKSVVDFELGSKHNLFFNLQSQAPVTTRITNPILSTPLRERDWDHIKDLQLVDPEFHKPARIDLLLGAPVYGYLLLPGLIKVSPMLPVAQNTEFGWILSGATRPPAPVTRTLTTFHLKLELEDQLKKFFEQEEVSKERILTREEKECEKFFEETVQRNEEGRYVVALPFKGDPQSLGSSKGQAFTRLMKLETRFKSNEKLKEDYAQILKEYETLKHTSVVGEFDKSTESTGYYLPHHAVFKPDSTTTKTRVVFDASAKTKNGPSLNDLLMTGPTLQQEMTSILLRWRLYRIVFTADIAKMYRQILVRMQDRKFQRFLFRENMNNPILEYEHNMVTFGVTSATYLAVKAMQHLAKLERENFPEAAEIILRDFFMDDGMSGADNVPQAIQICKDLKELLGKVQFPLRKFISNSAEVLESLPESDRELKLPLEINTDSSDIRA